MLACISLIRTSHILPVARILSSALHSYTTMPKRKAAKDDDAPPATKASKNVIDRTPILRKASVPSSACTIVSANVAGLRSVLNLENKRLALQNLLNKVDPDVFCIQEHKLQEQHAEELKDTLDNVFSSYERHFTFSKPPARKGYSGVAMFVKKKLKDSVKDLLQVENVSYGLGEKHESDTIASCEGRVVTVRFNTFNLINVYTPNSGAKLDRLDYRVKEWDGKFIEYVKAIEKETGKPVVIVGDLNVAHTEIDMHNFYTRPEFPEFDGDDMEQHYKGKARPLLKQAGCTPAERSSFTHILSQGYTDTFRMMYPNALGCFSYWSIRAGSRQFNKGLRLDYALASNSMCAVDASDATEKENARDGGQVDVVQNAKGCQPKVHDSFILHDEAEFPAFADHCPVGIVVKLS